MVRNRGKSTSQENLEKNLSFRIEGGKLKTLAEIGGIRLGSVWSCPIHFNPIRSIPKSQSPFLEFQSLAEGIPNVGTRRRS